jgi:V-type H+-transporting ATPase 16kDa proteolipid subunit
MQYDYCPTIAPFMGYMGVAFSIIFASKYILASNVSACLHLVVFSARDPSVLSADVGAALGTGRAGVGIMQSGIKSPELVWRNLIPIVMAGVNGIYGLITSIVILGSIAAPADGGVNRYSLYSGAAHLAAGLCCGLSGLGSGACIGVAGDAAIMACGTYDVESKRSIGGRGRGDLTGGKKKGGGGEKLFVAMVLVQVFAGNIALYGLIASIILSQQVYYCGE